MASPKLKQGSKGKLVGQLQKYLNLKGKLPKPIGEDEEFGAETKEAVKYFQKKAGLKVELDGTVGPETASALAKLVGSTATSFGKEFGELGHDEEDKAEKPQESADHGEMKPARV
jgi:peptidoglycan hydrolase-like protein with peptidoglycan-binding domain